MKLDSPAAERRPQDVHPDELVLAQSRRALVPQRLRRGVFRSVPDLIGAIHAYIALSNADPKPFVWTASVEAILAKVLHYRAILETVHQ